MLGLLEGKSESVKSLVRAQPDKAAGAQVNVGLEGVCVARAHPAVQAVAGNHQVGLVLCRQRLVVFDIGFKHQRHAQLQAAILQDVEQALAPHAAKAMAAGAHAATFEKDLDVIPVVEGITDDVGADRVGAAQVVQRLV